MFARFDLTKHLSDLPDAGRILVAPLNWGIGHATRCIPLINQLLEHGFQPVIASDGEALSLLQKVFPKLSIFELPNYNVRYAKNSTWFFIKLLWQLPKFIQTYFQEKRQIKKIIRDENIVAIISDNRFGIYHSDIPSIYITHQISVKSGFWTFLTTYIHQQLIKKFDKCWIPDVENYPNLSGDLSHTISLSKPLSYIGMLSQFHKQTTPIVFDILVLLSGPEPQRRILERKLLNQFQDTEKNVCFVKGIIEEEVKMIKKGNLTIYNYLLKDDLQLVINQSDLVIARSGYSTIMDLAVLQKKAFFIPTPGQSEQIYLAKHLEKERIAPYASQNDFKVALLKQLEKYTGF